MAREQFFFFFPCCSNQQTLCFPSNIPGIQRREPGADLRGRGDCVRHLVAERQRLRHRGVLVLHLDPAGVQRAQRERRQTVSSCPLFPLLCLSRARSKTGRKIDCVAFTVFGVAARPKLPTGLSHVQFTACPGYRISDAFYDRGSTFPLICFLNDGVS